MGQSESNPVKNIDKRTARREYHSDFVSAIDVYRRNIGVDDISTVQKRKSLGNIMVCVRKRPMFQIDLNNSEFDVITCVNDNVIVHDTRMHADMIKQCIKHHTFQFDRVFNEKTKNREVYSDTVQTLTLSALHGGYCTCLMYGQTGSGKTFTMTSIYQNVACDLFTNKSPGKSISMSICEISGDSCYDLLNKCNPINFSTDCDGSFHFFPVVEPSVESSDELLAYITYCSEIRATAATGVHDTSSRSHLIVRIYILDYDKNREGILTLVDLAGTEHKIDSMYHTSERRKESAKINASLMALKECIRARAAGKNNNHNYRQSKLTMALKSSFTLEVARTVVIVTISPSSKDTEHSLNSLRHACMMHGQVNSNTETRFVTGGQVTMSVIGEVNVAKVSRRNRAHEKAGRLIPGLKTSNGNMAPATEYCNELTLTSEGLIEYKLQSEQRSFSRLNSNFKQKLKYYRQHLDNNDRQEDRIRQKQSYKSNDKYFIKIVKRREHQISSMCQSKGNNSTDAEIDKFLRDTASNPIDYTNFNNNNTFISSKNNNCRSNDNMSEMSYMSKGANNLCYFDNNLFNKLTLVKESTNNACSIESKDILYSSNHRINSENDHNGDGYGYDDIIPNNFSTSSNRISHRAKTSRIKDFYDSISSTSHNNNVHSSNSKNHNTKLSHNRSGSKDDSSSSYSNEKSMLLHTKGMNSSINNNISNMEKFNVHKYNNIFNDGNIIETDRLNELFNERCHSLGYTSNEFNPCDISDGKNVSNNHILVNNCSLEVFDKLNISQSTFKSIGNSEYQQRAFTSVDNTTRAVEENDDVKRLKLLVENLTNKNVELEKEIISLRGSTSTQEGHIHSDHCIPLLKSHVKHVDEKDATDLSIVLLHSNSVTTSITQRKKDVVSFRQKRRRAREVLKRFFHRYLFKRQSQ